jgi:regulator of protease activity HflC (stomatin/prohibitin superfamily)
MSVQGKFEVSAASQSPSNPLLPPPLGQRQVIAEAPVPPLGCYGTFLHGLGTIWGCIGTVTICLCPPYKTIQQGEYGVVTQFGRYARVVEPGLVYFTPFVEEIRRVDTRLCTLNLERQMTLSKDNISLYADVVLLYRIINVHQASFQVQNLTALLQQCAYATIRQVFGTKTLQELLEKRHEIAADVYSIVENDARNWGVHIDAINIKDLILPENMVRVLSAAPIAKREAEAKIILAQADVESAKLMREASDILATDAAMQIVSPPSSTSPLLCFHFPILLSHSPLFPFC